MSVSGVAKCETFFEALTVEDEAFLSHDSSSRQTEVKVKSVGAQFYDALKGADSNDKDICLQKI